MRLTRTYIDAPLSIGATVTLPEAASAHLLRVLRLGVGDACVLFNGDGCDYDARLVSVAKKSAQAEVLRQREIDRESPLRIILGQGLARGEKMDLVLQKATELGVAAVAPLITERTEVKLDAERAGKRLAHWQGVLASACEQSGRARLPSLAEPQALAAWAAALPQDTIKLALDPEGECTLAALALPANAEVALAVGPEGGLSERDRATLRAAGFRGLRLGPRILRTETAGLAAIAALQALYGDCG
ncbi:16S rRNA (uracil(1498)-N(3))-methyltransferase [Rehaibacterium terrae]|jgi:16S rRNA (uracil1498-N3)-methyltransferase|uniref:Ribosomal RNA small subunit methyltransferase E n=1 Tax=Rehaibacterium terrae TaxID=1341696 RepID=A0A7W7Y121_9GAMM|nr:16S rRNA (uracil(1498)-N(3))-methyltransferase [Rehaibacterium terrae]MBB5015898.1 16S rRNA (uracil1498-N3)-methyltransferase [Rehaibacterium terrae]